MELVSSKVGKDEAVFRVTHNGRDYRFTLTTSDDEDYPGEYEPDVIVYIDLLETGTHGVVLHPAEEFSHVYLNDGVIWQR